MKSCCVCQGFGALFRAEARCEFNPWGETVRVCSDCLITFYRAVESYRHVPRHICRVCHFQGGKMVATDAVSEFNPWGDLVWIHADECLIRQFESHVRHGKRMKRKKPLGVERASA